MNLTNTKIQTKEDVALAKSLVEQSFSETDDAGLDEWLDFDEMLAEIERDRGLGLIATDKGKPVGMIYAQQESPINGKEGKEKWVVIVASVVPEATGKGIGGQLLTRLEEEVVKLGGVKMFIFTNKGDDQVIHFYQKNGYEDAGWVKDYQYGEGNSAVFLLKYLDKGKK